MKKIISMSFFLILINQNAYCQIDPPENNEEKFIGSVLSFQQISYLAVDSFGVLVKTTPEENISVLLDEKNNPYQAIDLNNGIEIFSAKFIISNTYVERIWKKIKKNKERNRKEYWKYNASGNITEHSQYLNDTLEKKEIAEYEKNRLIDYKSYAKDGKIDWQKSFKYDLKGNKIELLNFNIYGYYSHEKYIYDNKNKLILTISIDKNDKIEFKETYKYDMNGNLSETSTSYVNYEDRIYNCKKVFRYSNKGKITSEVRFNNDGTEYDRRTYSYDSKGRLTFEETPFGKHTYSFDLSGNLLEETNYFYDDSKNIESKSSTKYEYDSKGNWTKKIQSNIKSPKIIPDNYNITERTINYKL